MPMFFYTGLEQAIFYSNFTLSFVTCLIGIDSVGLVAMAYGVADAVFSLVAGKVSKFTGQSGLMFMAVVIQAVLLLLLLFKTPKTDESWIM